MASLHLAQEIFNIMWPVGSIYLSDNPTNPSNKFGGTWKRLKDGFLYCTANDNSDCNQGNLHGKADTTSTTLTVDQIPSHTHRQRSRGGDGNIAQSGDGIGAEFLGTSGAYVR